MNRLVKTRVDLLNSFKSFTDKAVKDLIFPVKPQKGDTEQEFRCPNTYLMRLPDSKAAFRKAPYILHQFITGSDVQQQGDRTVSEAVVRTIFCVYAEDEQEGALMLLNLMERLRIRLLRERVLDNQFALNLERKVEALSYTDDTAPFFAGEMVTTWKMPAVEREVLL